jgi:phenylpropionate dioxygenase-like ring-hydroxylating dioxygenase large terminal subunit
LKDINASDVHGEFDLRLQLETGPHSWWRTVANWCAAISHLPKNLSWSELQTIPTKQCLEPFAFMQLKKSAGSGYVSNKTLIDCARSDADEIRAQLSIYQPNVIVCCGVGQILADVLGSAPWRQTERGVRYMELTLFDNQPTYLIDYMHPSARAMKNVVCYGLLDAYQEVVGRLEHPDQ